MVATIGAITSSSAASSYYEADDYYADGGLSPSEWQGEGAKELAYDRDLRFGSEDPANPAISRRVLTIMLASEY